MSLKNSRDNIALIGFMGSGKSTVGRRLSQIKQMDFIEIDHLIESMAGKSILSIFKDDGEQVFRDMETAVIHQVSQGTNSIISCGGGVILNPANISELKKKSLLVYLFASPSVILKRVEESPLSRPLLNVQDQAKTIEKMLKIREPLYKESADLVIDTTDLNIEEVVDRIISELK